MYGSTPKARLRSPILSSKATTPSKIPKGELSSMSSMNPWVIVTVVAFAECGSSLTSAKARAAVVFIGTSDRYHSAFSCHLLREAYSLRPYDGHTSLSKQKGNSNTKGIFAGRRFHRPAVLAFEVFGDFLRQAAE